MVEGDAWYSGLINWLINVHEHTIGVQPNTPENHKTCTLCNLTFSDSDIERLVTEGV